MGAHVHLTDHAYRPGRHIKPGTPGRPKPSKTLICLPSHTTRNGATYDHIYLTSSCMSKPKSSNMTASDVAFVEKLKNRAG